MSRKTLFLLLLPLLIAACSETRETLGIGRVTPDEFAVVDRAPLVVPPDFKLQPPSPGAPRPTDVSVTERAAETVFGAPSSPAAAQSGAEQALLAEAGAAKSAPDIRRTIDQESAQRVSGSKHLVDDLLWWRKDANAGDATIVDPALELKRLHDAEAAKQPANSGATPVIERRKAGWLGL